MSQGKFMFDTWQQHFARRGPQQPSSSFRFSFAEPSLAAKPDVNLYYMMAVTIWDPAVSFKWCLHTIPCGVDVACQATASPASHARTARKIQGWDRQELLLQARYKCPVHGEFASGSDIFMSRLPSLIQEAFPYVLTEGQGVTKQCAL
jgi:hypothetical protein